MTRSLRECYVTEETPRAGGGYTHPPSYPPPAPPTQPAAGLKTMTSAAKRPARPDIGMQCTDAAQGGLLTAQNSSTPPDLYGGFHSILPPPSLQCFNNDMSFLYIDL